jgi:threonine dehydratase
MIALERVREARQFLARYLPRTPLVESPALYAALGARVHLKLETCSPVGSFKARGALFAISEWLKQSPAEPHVVTASSGNHGLAVAYAARLLDCKATVYVPEKAAAAKVEAIHRQRASLVATGRDLDEAKDLARRFAAETGAWWLEDGEETNVAAGAATVGAEILEDLPEVDEVVVPVGNGALAGGIGSAVRGLGSQAVVTGVQPEQAPAMAQSFRGKRPLPTDSCDTIADGLAARVPIPAAVDLMLEVVQGMVTVSEEAIRAAVGELVAEAHVLVEPAAAAALAGAYQIRERIQGKRVVLVMTGANIDTAVLLSCLAE